MSTLFLTRFLVGINALGRGELRDECRFANSTGAEHAHSVCVDRLFGGRPLTLAELAGRLVVHRTGQTVAARSASTKRVTAIDNP